MNAPHDDQRRQVERLLVERQQRIRPAQKMADVLANLMARRGYAQVADASAWDDAWREAAGAQLAGHSRAGQVRRGTLEVIVRNSAVMQELSFRKTALLKDLSRLFPEAKIKSLKFRVGAID